MRDISYYDHDNDHHKFLEFNYIGGGKRCV